MSFARFFAGRLAGGGTYARLAMWLATMSVALGLAVMEIALSVTAGFEKEVQRKIIGFTADLQIESYMPQADDTLRMFDRHDKQITELTERFPQIESVSPYIRRQAILKSEQSLEGIELKGLAPGWNQRFFQAALKAGKLPNLPDSTYGNQILISRKIADLLNLEVNAKARLYFWEKEKVRVRPVVISGIYETGLAEFDQYIVLCDLRLLQRIMGWGERFVQGFEIHLKPAYAADSVLGQEINRSIHYAQRAVRAQDLYPELFQWLGLQHQNVSFILILMTAVATINMAAAILVLITEQTTTIGLLKAIGAADNIIANIFLWQALQFIAKGIMIGNVLALSLLLLQEKTGLITLDQDSYFVPVAPVSWEWLKFLYLNVGVLIVCGLTMYLPIQYVKKIPPARALRM